MDRWVYAHTVVHHAPGKLDELLRSDVRELLTGATDSAPTPPPGGRFLRGAPEREWVPLGVAGMMIDQVLGGVGERTLQVLVDHSEICGILTRQAVAGVDGIVAVRGRPQWHTDDRAPFVRDLVGP